MARVTIKGIALPVFGTDLRRPQQEQTAFLEGVNSLQLSQRVRGMFSPSGRGISERVE